MSIGKVTVEIDEENNKYRCNYTFTREEAATIMTMSDEELDAFLDNFRDRVQLKMTEIYMKEFEKFFLAPRAGD